MKATEKKDEPAQHPKVVKVQEERKASEDDDMSGQTASASGKKSGDSSPMKVKEEGLGSSNVTPSKFSECGASPVRTIPSRLGGDKPESSQAAATLNFGVVKCEDKD